MDKHPGEALLEHFATFTDVVVEILTMGSTPLSSASTKKLLTAHRGVKSGVAEILALKPNQHDRQDDPDLEKFKTSPGVAASIEGQAGWATHAASPPEEKGKAKGKGKAKAEGAAPVPDEQPLIPPADEPPADDDSRQPPADEPPPPPPSDDPPPPPADQT